MTHSRKLSASLSLATLATLGLAVSGHAQLTPISLSGYNLAGIANGAPTTGAGIPAALLASTGPGTVNGGTLDSQYVYYAEGFDSTTPTSGLPVGTSFLSAATNTLGKTVTFSIMPASMSTPTPNVLDVYSGLTSATLSLTTPGKYSTLSFLENGYNGSQTVTYTLNYTTGSAVTGTFTAGDNFGGTNPAFYVNGRIGVTTATGGNYETFTSVSAGGAVGNPRLYEIDVTGVDTTRTLSSVTFTDTALSGTTNGSGFGIFGVSGLAVAPEPSEYAGLLLGGLGLLGLVARKRRVNA
jgi:hypothetical protein